MIITNNKVEVLDLTCDYIDTLKMVERCGRECYKSSDKMTDDSHIRFLKMISLRGHTSVLEHGVIYFYTPNLNGLLNKLFESSLSAKEYAHDIGHVNIHQFKEKKGAFLSMNLRTIYEGFNGSLKHIHEEMLKYDKYNGDLLFSRSIFDESLPLSIININTLWTTDRTTTQSLVRHRVMGISQESTRYCNYSKDKFGSDVSVILPTTKDLDKRLIGKSSENKITCNVAKDRLEWGSGAIVNVSNISHVEENMIKQLCKSCDSYIELINVENYSPDDARVVLPFYTASNIYLSGTMYDWFRNDNPTKGFVNLRSHHTAHNVVRNLTNNQLVPKIESIFGISREDIQKEIMDYN